MIAAIFKNPFYVYIISFLMVFSLYQLGWSELYPPLTYDLKLFFALTFFIALIFGLYFQSKNFVKYKLIESNLRKRAIIFLGLIYFGHSLEFIHAGGIPFFNLLSGRNIIDYSEYGIKTFHVFLVPFNSFVVVFLFHLYLSKKSKVLFLYYLLALLPSLLINNRGMFIFGITSSFFVYFISLNRRIGLEKIILFTLLIFAVLYFFGLIGNIRSGGGDKYYIPIQSKASNEFLNSSIPLEYYWTYLYGASPLANFQNTINRTTDIPFSVHKLFIFEMLPDFISKRISNFFGQEKAGVIQITPWLTAGTMYSESFRYLGWLGPLILFGYQLFLIIVTLGFINNKSDYHVTTVAILSTLVFFNTFANMLVFAGGVLQLFYPILFSLFSKYRFKYAKN